jgi:F0F1-type ATP synthase assembly protein I
VDKVLAAIIAVVVVVAVLVPVGIGVCILGLVTGGSPPVLIVGAGLGISLACYCGYRAALSVLGDRRPAPPLIREIDKRHDNPSGHDNDPS